MKDTLVIVAGDCGFGFERKGYYENIVKRNAKRVNESNNWFLPSKKLRFFVRLQRYTKIKC